MEVASFSLLKGNPILVMQKVLVSTERAEQISELFLNVFNKEPVKDGSDFTKFKKLEAKNKTYNDSSFGGSNNGSFTFLNRVRS